MIKRFLSWEFFEKLFLLILHLLLLGWIYYLLSEGGRWSFRNLFFHFIGLTFFGAGLIYISAYLAKKRFLKEQKRIN